MRLLKLTALGDVHWWGSVLHNWWTAMGTMQQVTLQSAQLKSCLSCLRVPGRCYYRHSLCHHHDEQAAAAASAMVLPSILQV
jgi:hypothetical protein